MGQVAEACRAFIQESSPAGPDRFARTPYFEGVGSGGGQRKQRSREITKNSKMIHPNEDIARQKPIFSKLFDRLKPASYR